MKKYFIEKTMTVFFSFLLYYFIVFIIFYICSIILLNKGKIIDIWPINDFQKNIYFSGHRNVFQSNIECVEKNTLLGYVPKIGECTFFNPEFNTKLNFDDNGRVIYKELPYKKNLIFLGDSFGMGWGVNDSETYTYLLSKKIDRNIVNLSVSSYGTARELLRYDLYGKKMDDDIIFIQYNEGDLYENISFNRGDDTNHFYDKIQINSENKNIITLKTLASLTKQNLFFIFKTLPRLLKNKIQKVNKLEFFEHQHELQKIFQKYDHIIPKKKIVIFYINEIGNEFRNFPNGIDVFNKNIYWLNIKLNKKDYFQMDDHINSNGHENVSIQLEKFIKSDTYINFAKN